MSQVLMWVYQQKKLNEMKITKESLELTRKISDEINNQTFHHHYHILYDIANTFSSEKEVLYVEIGCYAGGSACLMLQRPNTKVISIDLGKPISQSVVKNNVKKLNIHENYFDYIEGSSQDEKTIQNLKSLILDKKIDILFIDGDHSYTGVQEDFKKYKDFVNSGGFIVFDDYNDSKYSPEVKKAVDELDFNGYIKLGVFGSEFGARPSENQSNEFVIKKL